MGLDSEKKTVQRISVVLGNHANTVGFWSGVGGKYEILLSLEVQLLRTKLSDGGKRIIFYFMVSMCARKQRACNKKKNEPPKNMLLAGPTKRRVFSLQNRNTPNNYENGHSPLLPYRAG
jgi:hypothetical protein